MAAAWKTRRGGRRTAGRWPEAWSQDGGELEAVPASMADAAHRGKREMGRGRREWSANERRSVWTEARLSPSRIGAQGAWQGRGGGGSNGEPALVHGGHVPPLRHILEHLAGLDEAELGRRFGPARFQIWTWAKNKVCSPHETLQIILRGFGH